MEPNVAPRTGLPEGRTGLPEGGELVTPSERVARTFIDRLAAGDHGVIDELMHPDFVNHAAGPQGREGWKTTLAVVEHDLGPTSSELHALVAQGDLVAHHMTLHGTHRASSMPLLTGIAVTGRAVSWTFMHLWRVAGGQVVEHWACRDDVGLLAQLGAFPDRP